jgi:hypothetical protein
LQKRGAFFLRTVNNRKVNFSFIRCFLNCNELGKTSEQENNKKRLLYNKNAQAHQDTYSYSSPDASQYQLL